MKNNNNIKTGIIDIDNILSNGINPTELELIIGPPTVGMKHMSVYMERAKRLMKEAGIGVIETNTDPIITICNE